jgi:phosphoribosylformylglycinamidine synthase
MKPEVFWTFKKCVEGIRDACLKFNIPVTGGNVSFYNESPQGAVDPTPVIGLAGLIENREAIPSAFQNSGDLILLAGETREEIGGSEFLKVIHHMKDGIVPRLNLDEALAFNQFLMACANQELLVSAHDLAEGGLAVALAESCISNDYSPYAKRKFLGADIEVNAGNISNESLLFGESQSRAILTCKPGKLSAVQKQAEKLNLPLSVIGKVGGQNLKINQLIDTPLAVLEATWQNAIRKRMVK